MEGGSGRIKTKKKEKELVEREEVPLKYRHRGVVRDMRKLQRSKKKGPVR